MRCIAVIQARMGSSRLPGKVLLDLAGRAVLEHVVLAARAIPGVDDIVIATSTEGIDDAIVNWASARELALFRGAETDVLSRLRQAADSRNADIVVRLTADCPLLDPHICGQIIALVTNAGADYASNVDPPTWPDGLDCEAMTIAALQYADEHATIATDREHVTPYIRRHRVKFDVRNLRSPETALSERRWTLDTPADLARLNQLCSRLDTTTPSYLQVLAADKDSDVQRSTSTDTLTQRNASFAEQRDAIKVENTRFDESIGTLERALKTVPLAAQTFSKCHQQMPQPLSPLFLTHGHAGRVWDVDGNEYVDLGCGLLSVLLGHRDPDVDTAITRQLENGISFTLPTILEAELAERLVDMIPCAEQVRFAKNGSDATSGCVRVARAYTGRDRIAVAGYHGWQDWYIGSTTRNKGVPSITSALTHTFPYGDLDALHRLLASYPGEFAAVVLEPMNVTDPPPGYLDSLAKLVRHEGALLVFDEIITGFRFARGGAQELFGVSPDLAAIGKGLGNGMPISAVVGSAEIMQQMEEVFFSGTFGGEALSLAAALAVTRKVQDQPVVEKLHRQGQALRTQVESLISDYGLGESISLSGHPSWVIIQFHDVSGTRKEVVRTAWMQQMLANGVLSLGSHNLCYAHNEGDMQQVLYAWEATLNTLARWSKAGNLASKLRCPPIEPVFKVR
jgi:glutamate-1-semialdehyde aminotransferase/spore coat polysaccharide biosynthesis protein SpsF (cytidylyltransferase family)